MASLTDRTKQGRLLIGITGPMGAGKTTVAKQILLYNSNIELFSISKKIKSLVSELNLSYRRDILQETGDFFRKYNSLIWVEYLLRQINLNQSNIGAVVDDIRYSEECSYLRKQKFFIIRVIASDNLRRERIAKRDAIAIDDKTWTTWNQHPTEKDTLTMPVDLEITNNGSLEDISQEVQRLLKNFKYRSQSLTEFIL